MMHDDCTPHPGPPARRGNTSEPPPQPLVQDARAALRGTDAYLGALVQRFELARIDARVLAGLPAWAVTSLMKDLDVLQVSAERVLRYLDPETADTARLVASLFRRGAEPE